MYIQKGRINETRVKINKIVTFDAKTLGMKNRKTI